VKRGSRSCNPIHSRSQSEGDLPSLVQLDSFSESSLRQWQAASRNLSDLNAALFFGLELERQRHSEALIDAVRCSLTSGEPFENWARIVDYRYCCAPLSVAGSVKRDGGRFNMGATLGPVTFSPFPALYIAENYPTAYNERFGSEPSASGRGLTSDELALRGPGSFTHVALRGRIELVMDIRETHSLQRIASVLRKFSLPGNVRYLARRLNMRSPPGLVRSAAALQRQLLHKDWRTLPMQFDLPSNSQIFGRIAVAAGAHAVLYSSVRQEGSACLALFPQNWAKTSSFVEVMDGTPSQARLTRIDGGIRDFY